MTRNRHTVRCISQEQLRRAVFLQSEIRRLRAQLAGIREEIFTALKRGAAVEEGPHAARIVTVQIGRSRYERLYIS